MGSPSGVQPIFLLVQECTGLAHAPAEVCVVVSSLVAHNEAKTRYRNVERKQAVWNDSLELDIASPQASAGILLQVSVLSATSAAGHTHLAAGACVVNGPLAMTNTFCDERLILKRADGNQARLRLAVSWSRHDIAMLYRGLLPCSRKTSIGQPPSNKDLHKACCSQPEIDNLRICCGDEVAALPDPDLQARDAEDRRGISVEAAPWPDAGGREASGAHCRMVEAVLKLPPKALERMGRILVRQNAPYKIASMNQAAEDLSRALLKEPPALGRSVAALETTKSEDLLRACSHVSASSSPKAKVWAAILLGDNLLVFVQDCKDQSHSMRGLTRCLEVLLFFLEDDDSRAELQQLFVRVGIVLGDDRSFCSAQGAKALPFQRGTSPTFNPSGEAGRIHHARRACAS